MVDASPGNLLRSSMPARQNLRRGQPAPVKPLAFAIAAAICSLLPVYAAASACSNPEVARNSDLDWVPVDQLTAAQRAAMPNACCGAYVAPLRTDADANSAPEITALRATADSSDAQLQSRIAMHGNVSLTQGYRSIRADSATYSPETRDASISGNIQLREPGMLLKADEARVDLDQGDSTLEGAEFVLYESRVRGTADKLEKFGDRLLRLENSRFTSCEPGSNLWSVAGSEIKIRPDEHYGTARHMRLNIFDVPVLYSPYMRFPVGDERLTGFLFPSISFDRKTGIDDIEVPFYWNIAPNYDMTLMPRYMSEHGVVLNVEGRHLSNYFESLANVSYMADDKGNYDARTRQKIEQGLKKDHTGEERWMLNFNQRGGHGERWGTKIDYTDLSDNDYLLDLNRSSIDSNRQASVTQRLDADYRTDNWLFGAKVEEIRLLTNSNLPYRELPRVNADGLYRFGNFQLELDNEYARFDRNSFYRGNRTTLITGERFRSDYQLSWNKNMVWGFFKPAVAWRTLGYQLEDESLVNPDRDAPSLHAPQASIDMGLYFERDKNWFGQNFTQTLEPRVFYLYSDHANHDDLYNLTSDNRYVNFDTSQLTFTYSQLFRDTRFAGGDRLDDANQVSIGLSSAWIEQKTGIERLRMSVGQILYIDDRRVSIFSRDTDQPENLAQTSPIAARLSGRFGKSVRLNSDLVYDHRENHVDSASVTMRYMDDQYRILNLGYRYRRDPIMASPLNPNPIATEPQNQVDASVIWPVVGQWSVIARTNYDFEYQVELDTFAGLEYNDCCYRVRIMTRRWLNFDYSANFLKNVTGNDYDRGVFVDIQLKGLGNISERVSNLMDKAIVNYSRRENALR
jgi:LPS-assembly protein